MQPNIFYLVQAFLGLIWWVGILCHPPLQAFFGLDDRDVDRLFAPDLIGFVGGSFCVAICAESKPEWYKPSLYILFGITFYAFLYCATMNIVATAFMFPPLLINYYFLVRK